MKKLFTLVAVICAFFAFSTPSQAQTNHGGSYNISIDPFDLLISDVVNVTFEAACGKNSSFTINGSFYNYNKYWTAWGLGASYRWYIDLFKEGKKHLNGFSVGPMARVSWWSFDDDKGYYGYDGGTYVTVGGEAAYKWIFGSGFSIEPIVRLGFGVTDIDGLGYDGWGAGINLGYTW